MQFYVIINTSPMMRFRPYCLAGGLERTMFHSLEEAEDCMEDLQSQHDDVDHLEIHEVESEPV